VGLHNTLAAIPQRSGNVAGMHIWPRRALRGAMAVTDPPSPSRTATMLEIAVIGGR